MKKTLPFYLFPIILFFTLWTSVAAQAEETSSENSSSVYGTITFITTIDNHYILSIFDGNLLHVLSADASTPCLYQGKNIPLSQLQIGSQILASYMGEQVSSILTLSLGNSTQIATSVYGMYYDFREGQLWITVPGGTLKNYSLASQVTYFVNQNQVNYYDFYKLSLPGDDIKIYLNEQNEVVKIESYVTKDDEVAKTNPNLLQ